jgi:hypothetical protein
MTQVSPQNTSLLDSFDMPDELKVIHMFLREAFMTKYYHQPNYELFKSLARNLYKFVGVPKLAT